MSDNRKNGEMKQDETTIAEQFSGGNNNGQESETASRGCNTDEMEDNFSVTDELLRKRPRRQGCLCKTLKNYEINLKN